MAKKVSAGGAEVRAFLKAQGVPVGERGRFSADQVEKFETATGKRYIKGHVEPRKITGVRLSDSGRKVPVTVKATDSEVRAWGRSEAGQAVLATAGVSVPGERGRLRPEVLSAFAAKPKV